MILSERRAVHVGRNQGVAVHGFLDGNAADKWRNFPRNIIETAKHHVLSGGLNAGVFKNIF